MHLNSNCLKRGRNNIKIFLTIFSIILISWTSGLRAQKQDSFTAKGRSIKVDSFNMQVKNIMNDVGIPGLSLAIIDNDQIVFSNTYGYKNLKKSKKVNNRTIFEAASLSKGFLVLVAHQLVDEGKLDLDKPVYQYLENEQLEYDPRYKVITPRMILSHTSGIENWKWMNNPDTLEILSNPGDKFVYSGEAYNYLSKVIEGILNHSFEEYVNDRVIEPLQLKRTFSHYNEKSFLPFRKGSPGNYAIGYNNFNEEVKKHKNYEPVPSSGFNLIASDYAQLIIAIFNKEHLSENRINDLVKPAIKLDLNNPLWFYGLGFEILYSATDTIILHGGSNNGYKAFVCYSIKNKCGFVFLSNSDRGSAIEKKMCEISVGLNIDLRYGAYMDQYPSNANLLFKIYKEEGLDEMLLKLQDIENTGEIDENTLNELSRLLFGRDNVTVKKLVEKNIKLYPESSFSYFILAKLNMNQREYELAYKNFTKAQELNFFLMPIEPELIKCKQELNKQKEDSIKRVSICATYEDVNLNEVTKIEAEDYCTMNGIGIEETKDLNGGQDIGYMDENDWVDYKINVASAGISKITMRVASLTGEGAFLLKSGQTTLATFDVPITGGWQEWTNITANANLSAGQQTLRLLVTSGGFNLNWIQFSPIEQE